MPYIYSIPHIGNVTGSVLPADVLYKYLKMKGEDVIYICGSDMHGTTLELAAIKQKIPVEHLANEMHEKTKQAFDGFNITFTYYGKTHSESNKEITYQIFEGLNKNGYIIETESEHAFCEVDQRFIADRFIEGTCPFCKKDAAKGDQCDNCGRLLVPSEIINPRCTICGKNKIRFLKTKNLAIDYKKLQPKILSFVKESDKNNWSKNATNKTLSYIDEGLRPVEITRTIKWGFQVPLKGFEDSVFYVWFDAPIGYIGITKEWNEGKWKDYWLAKDTKLIQFMGKDNIQFHTIHWPGMLIGSKLGYVTPTSIRASEFLIDKEGAKLSKSKGTGIAIDKAVKIFPADYWRFALMYMYPETSDSEFSVQMFKEVVNNILNDKIGNLIHRVFTIARANKELIQGEIRLNSEHAPGMKTILEKYNTHFDKIELREALRCVVELADLGNAIMSNVQPWTLVKKATTDKQAAKQFSDTIKTLLVVVYNVAIISYPFIPESSKQALALFGIKSEPTLAMLNDSIVPDLKKESKPIFSKITGNEFE